MTNIIIKLFLLLFITLYQIVEIDSTSPDRVVFFDVDQGDSTLIELDGKKIFIDGGPKDNIVFQLKNVLKYKFTKIDILIITHLHSDHYSGARDLIEKFDIGEVYIPNYCEFDLVLKHLDFQKSYIHRLNSGEFKAIQFHDSSMTLGVLGPLESSCIEIEDANDRSIITQLQLRDGNFLFMGDAEVGTERLYENSVFNRKAQVTKVLKAGHHCSNTSSSIGFIRIVQPSLIVCSVGQDNIYGHPSPEVLNRFDEMGIEYLLTYRQGDVVINL